MQCPSCRKAELRDLGPTYKAGGTFSPRPRMYRYECPWCLLRWSDDLTKSRIASNEFLANGSPAYCLIKNYCHCQIMPDSDTLEIIQRLRDEKKYISE